MPYARVSSIFPARFSLVPDRPNVFSRLLLPLEQPSSTCPSRVRSARPYARGNERTDPLMMGSARVLVRSLACAFAYASVFSFFSSAGLSLSGGRIFPRRCNRGRIYSHVFVCFCAGVSFACIYVCTLCNVVRARLFAACICQEVESLEPTRANTKGGAGETYDIRRTTR